MDLERTVAQSSRSRLGAYAIAATILVPLSAVLGAAFGRETESPGGSRLALAMGGALFAAYCLSIVHWLYLAKGVWGYVWRGYVLSNISFIGIGATIWALDLRSSFVPSLAIALILPWLVGWLWLVLMARVRGSPVSS
jgi:hypothetical protein